MFRTASATETDKTKTKGLLINVNEILRLFKSYRPTEFVSNLIIGGVEDCLSVLETEMSFVK